MDNTFDTLWYGYGELIAGIDESGVSDIAGPLVAACVVLPKINADFEDLRIFNVDDSKNIHEKYRKSHAEVIWNVATAIGIGETQPAEIDYLGKRRATILAMMRAIAACQTKTRKPLVPEVLLIDGEFELPVTMKQEAIKDGDKKSLSIAAASIIAKVYRDDVMLSLHERTPYYGWNKNKGHPCENHFKGLDTHGILVGVHRINCWPFVPNEKGKEDEKQWYYRRGVWRHKTSETLTLETGGDAWISRQALSTRHSQSSSSKRSKKPPLPQKPPETGTL
jgi:ribonuclease HII